ncbi:hypothetical protein J6590_059813 [Homalodisca vitripennis]|nr:hypothetical protein J6590_059813 [Homalodisca vitripennis]
MLLLEFVTRHQEQRCRTDEQRNLRFHAISAHRRAKKASLTLYLETNERLKRDFQASKRAVYKNRITQRSPIDQPRSMLLDSVILRLPPYPPHCTIGEDLQQRRVRVRQQKL